MELISCPYPNPSLLPVFPSSLWVAAGVLELERGEVALFGGGSSWLGASEATPAHVLEELHCYMKGVYNPTIFQKDGGGKGK